ncbi:hypothetical protein LXL04_004858 [Taraxacum kok-saghyz]
MDPVASVLRPPFQTNNNNQSRIEYLFNRCIEEDERALGFVFFKSQLKSKDFFWTVEDCVTKVRRSEERSGYYAISSDKPFLGSQGKRYIFRKATLSITDDSQSDDSVPLIIDVCGERFIVAVLHPKRVPTQKIHLLIENEFTISHTWKHGNVILDASFDAQVKAMEKKICESLFLNGGFGGIASGFWRFPNTEVDSVVLEVELGE